MDGSAEASSRAPLPECPDHPGRPVDATCARCGRFVCDWCVKLAPSWAPGLCRSCQAARAPARTGSGMRGLLHVVGATLLVGPFFSLKAVLDFARVLPRTLPGEERNTLFLTVALQTILFVFSVLTAVRFFLRRRNAPTLVRVLYGAYLAVDLLGWASGQFHPAVVIRVVIAVAWIAFFTWSKQVKETFVR